MSEPITWGDYFAYKFLTAALVLILPFVLYPLMRLLQTRECQSCGRSLHFRAHKPHALASRWFCPFHDEGSPYP